MPGRNGISAENHYVTYGCDVVSIICSNAICKAEIKGCHNEYQTVYLSESGLLCVIWWAVSSTKSNTVNDIPELASEPAAAFRCKPEVGSETREFF